MPDVEIYMLFSWKVNSGLGCKQVPKIVIEIMVPQKNGLGSAAELYYLDPVAIMDRFMGQPKFAGKTYTKFERQE